MLEDFSSLERAWGLEIQDPKGVGEEREGGRESLPGKHSALTWSTEGICVRKSAYGQRGWKKSHSGGGGS